MSWAFESRAPRATVLLRLVVGAVFVTEGLQKFLFPDELGVGRFIRIGIPMPAVTAPFVGMVEVLGGVFIIVGIATRIVCLPLLISMLVAITSTKLVTLEKNGFWETMHEARTDLLMIFLPSLPLGSGRGTHFPGRQAVKAWCAVALEETDQPRASIRRTAPRLRSSSLGCCHPPLLGWSHVDQVASANDYFLL